MLGFDLSCSSSCEALVTKDELRRGKLNAVSTVRVHAETYAQCPARVARHLAVKACPQPCSSRVLIRLTSVSPLASDHPTDSFAQGCDMRAKSYDLEGDPGTRRMGNNYYRSFVR